MPLKSIILSSWLLTVYGTAGVVIYLFESCLTQSQKYKTPSENRIIHNGLLAKLGTHYTTRGTQKLISFA